MFRGLWNIPLVRKGLVLAVLLCGALSAAPSNAVTRAVLGDVTGDSRVAVDDAVRVLRVAVGLALPTRTDLRLGDVAPRKGVGNRIIGDGALTVADVLAILRRAVGLISDEDFGANLTLVFVEPDTVVLGPGDRQRFDAMVVGPMVTGVSWRVVGSAGGIISTDGVYTAPQKIIGVQKVIVEAQVDASIGTAEVVLDEEGAPPPPPPLG
jgi:hypothetical protein